MRTTLIALTVAVLGGAVILFPSLALLFRLDLTGRLAEGGESVNLRPTPRLVRGSRQGFLGRAALACLMTAIGLLTAAEAGWAHALGVVSLFGFVALGFPAALPPTVGPRSAVSIQAHDCVDSGNSKEDWGDNPGQAR